MPQFKCPQCATVISAQPGEEAHCLNCGFRAMVPAGGGPPVAPPPPSTSAPMASPPPAPLPTPAPPPPQGEVMPLAKSTAAWGYLLSIAGIGTFFLAGYGLPFVLGLGGVALGFTAYFKNRKDRRGLLASVLGGIAVVFALVYLLA